jgi:KDO2-lipid IV(A) lauroyltransferase
MNISFKLSMNKLTNLPAYIFLRFLCFLLMLLPLRVTYLLARLIGSLMYHVFRFRRRIVLANLQIAFGNEMMPERLKKIAQESYKQTAMTFLELLIAPKLKKQVRTILEPEQKVVFRDLLRQGSGLVIVSGHLGGWELGGAAAAAVMEQPFTVAAVQQSNPYINRFITQRRTDMGMRVAGSKEAMKLLVRALKSGQAIGLVADQSGGRSAVLADFFGRISATQPGPAKLALKFKTPMLVGAAIRIGVGKFKFLLQQVEIREDDTVESLTQRHVKILESFIRQYPEQYFWLHRRWKKRPPAGE